MGIEPNVGAFALASGAARRVMKSIEWVEQLTAALATAG
jgi:hypothetical protein